MRRCGLLVVVAACGGGASAAPSVVESELPGPAEVTSAFYEGLFRQGARWRYQVTQAYESYYEEETEEETEEEAIEEPAVFATCWVALTGESPGGRVSQIACDEELDASDVVGLVGAWAIDARGLWHSTDLEVHPGVVPAFEDTDLWVALPPVARTDETDAWPGETPESLAENGIYEEQLYVVEITQLGDDAWCRNDRFNASNGSHFQVCLDPVGPLRWNLGQESHGSSYEAAFERVEDSASASARVSTRLSSIEQ